LHAEIFAVRDIESQIKILEITTGRRGFDQRLAALETVMPSRTERHLELLALSQPLHRHARSLQSDANAAFLLVHRALSKAFAEKEGDLRPSAGLEASLCADIDGSLRNLHARA
jgi:hypothetical protein